MRYRIHLIVALMAAMTSARATPQAEVRRGSDHKPGPRRVVVLPPNCSSVDGACEDDYAIGVSGIVKSELEFAGHSVIDAETLVASARTRADASSELKVFGEKVSSAREQLLAIGSQTPVSL